MKHPNTIPDFLSKEFSKITAQPPDAAAGSVEIGSFCLHPRELKESLYRLLCTAKALHSIEGKTISGIRFSVDGGTAKLFVNTVGDPTSNQPLTTP